MHREINRRSLDPFLSAARVAELICISRRTVYRMIAEGRLQPDGYLNGRMRFKWSQVQRLLQKGSSTSSMASRFPLSADEDREEN